MLDIVFGSILENEQELVPESDLLDEVFGRVLALVKEPVPDYGLLDRPYGPCSCKYRVVSP